MNLKLSKIKDKQAAIEVIDYSIKRKIDISVINVKRSLKIGNKVIRNFLFWSFVK